MAIDVHAVRSQRWGNLLHSALLVLALGTILSLLGLLIAGLPGLLMVSIPVAMFLVAGPRIAPSLIMRMYRARPIPRHQAPGLYEIVDSLSARAGLERSPTLFHIPSALLNAFAVGSERQSAIGLTDAMFRVFSTRELAAVMAHELAHIANRDLHVMGLADLLSRSTQFLSNIGFFLLLLKLPLVLAGSDLAISFEAILLLLFAPTLSALLQLSLSRTREFQADLDAAGLTGDPRGLAMALQRLEAAQVGFFARIFQRVQQKIEPSILRTHPETAERIRRLLELEQTPHTRPTPPVSESPLRFEDLLEALQRGGRPPRTPRRHFSGLFY
jgi:heat shock protein HtpX